MNKNYSHQQHQGLPLPHKLTPNLIHNQNKHFELLYRQRDQSALENPIESIIFVKSKPCKTASNHKKIKVHQQFKKIIKDLNAHVNQHKKSHKSQKKYISTASTQPKTPFSTKKSTKQIQFISKKLKQNEKDPNKVFKTLNKTNQILNKQKSPIIDSVKSPKKNDKSYLSPKSKQLLSPKSQKLEKQNIETKRVNQKLQRKKSPQPKTNRKQNFSQFDHESTTKKPKTNPFSESSHRPIEGETKTQIKRNIRSIPLQVQEYIFLEDNFERIKKRSLYKLQTKLLSTYRNNCKELENKILLKENPDQNDIVFQKINQQCFEEGNLNYIERSSLNSDVESSQCEAKSEKLSQIQNELQLAENQLSLDQKEIIQNIVLIQKWWKKIIKIQAIKVYLLKSLQKNESFKSNRKSETEQNFTTPVNLASAKSIQFNDELRISEEDDNYIHNTTDEMSMLKNQNEIVMQKKILHQKILTNLLNEKKITSHDFQNKMALVQREYEKELKDIMNLYKIIQFGSRSQTNFQQQSNEKDIKIIQGPNDAVESDEFNQTGDKEVQDHTIPENQSEQDEIPLKIYKIGDKITSQMQNHIEEAKKIRDSSQKLANDFFSDKYSKKTNELGEEYFEDFESDSSNDQSPHKMLLGSNFQEFESQILPDNHGSSFEPNAHFITMLERKFRFISEYKENEMIKMKIDQRIAVQMGAMRAQNGQKYAVDTSILGIHQFLVNFFKFYLHYYKDQFLRFINMPYGYQPEQRLKFIQGYQDTSDQLSEDSDGIIYGLEYIISDDVFDEFSEQYYGASMEKGNEEEKAMIECSKIHDRALFECFNEALNNFRPYYSISGPPYIWNCSQKTLTFYFIAEENVNEVFEKTEYRLMKWASGLLGLYVEGYDSRDNINSEKEKVESIEEIMARNHSSCHALVFEKREENLVKEERVEFVESMSKWGDIEEQRTSTLLQLSSVMLEELAKEFMIEFLIQSSQNPFMEHFF